MQANNIQVSNVGFEGTPGEFFYEIFFDISWENSWRTSTFESNYDAAWVFVKYRSASTENEWKHAIVDGLNAPAGSELISPSDFLGAFVQRDANGIGEVNFSDVRLAWQLEEPFEPEDEIEICVFAIEMVYIPEGAFEVGDGMAMGTENDFARGGSVASYTIQSEAGLTLGGNSPSNLSIQPNSSSSSCSIYIDDFDNTSTQFLPPQFPKGFQGFYIMKYELSQGQYASFLNTITSNLESSLFNFQAFGSSGYSIRTTGEPTTYIAETPERACNQLSWVHLSVYADWSGLRPMSELEYEKACRGPRPSVPGEFAWGTNKVFNEVYEFDGIGTELEQNSNSIEGLGNCISQNTASEDRPYRCGVFSQSGGESNRVRSGASYYGVFELTGNLYELTISVGSIWGRVFDGSVHGDGEISLMGVSTWPGTSALEGQTPALGTGLRGGAFPNPTNLGSFRVSSRCYSNAFLSSASAFVGGRLVRSDF